MSDRRLRSASAAAPALIRLLTAEACAAGCRGKVSVVAETPWASATFVGARHLLRYVARPSPARAAWLAALPDADLPMPRHVLADLIVESVVGDDVLLATLTLDSA